MQNNKVSREKFPHDTARIVFFDTFLYNSKIYYLIQCESKKVYVGECNGFFKKVWEDTHKPKITTIFFLKER